MMDILGTLIGGVISGGATGLLGVLIQRWFDLQNKVQEIEVIKLNHQNALALATLESERAQMRAEADIEIADRNLLAREAEADSRSMVASFEADKAAYLDKGVQLKKGRLAGLVTIMMALVDFTRGILRPGMTAYLCGLVTAMFLWVRELAVAYGLTLTPDQVVQLMTQIIATILYVFTASALWWFGARPPKRQGDA